MAHREFLVNKKGAPEPAAPRRHEPTGDDPVRNSTLHPLETPPVDIRLTKAAPRQITKPVEANAPELVDNGRRLALIEAADSLGAVQRMRLELGTSRAEMALERLEDIRTELREAMKIVDTVEYRDLHVALGEYLIRHDSLVNALRERVASE